MQPTRAQLERFVTLNSEPGFDASIVSTESLKSLSDCYLVTSWRSASPHYKKPIVVNR